MRGMARSVLFAAYIFALMSPGAGHELHSNNLADLDRGLDCVGQIPFAIDALMDKDYPATPRQFQGDVDPVADRVFAFNKGGAHASFTQILIDSGAFINAAPLSFAPEL